MLTFVVAGAGFAGVEICSEINGLVRDSLRYYPAIASSEIRVVLVSASPRILQAMDAKLAERARERLTRWGVDVRLNTGVHSATATAAILSDGERLPTRTIVVTTGIGPHPLLAASGLSLVEGRLACDEYGRVSSAPGLFAAGDDAAILDRTTGQVFPATASSAHAQGRMVARNIVAELEGKSLRGTTTPRAQVAALTRHYGLVQTRRLRFDGFFAALVWRLTFLKAIPSWYRRTTLLLDWLLTSTFPRDVTQLRIARTNAVLPMRFAAGEVILRQGEPGSRFYVITEGEVEILKKDSMGIDQPVTRLGPGRYFGEIALLRGARRTATVRALTDLAVVSLDRKDFGTLVRVMPHLLDTVAAAHDLPLSGANSATAAGEPRTELRRLSPEESEQLRERK